MGHTVAQTDPPMCNPISFSFCTLRLQVCILIPSADILKNIYNREDVNQVVEDPGSLFPEVPSSAWRVTGDTLEASCPTMQQQKQAQLPVQSPGLACWGS